MRLMRMVAVAAAFAMAGCGGGGLTAPKPQAGEAGPIKIGLLLDSLENERWRHDRDLFVARVEELHAKVEVRDGAGDHAKQLDGARQLLDAGVKALVVVPHDLDKAKEIVALAAEKKVPVISYDRLIRDADVALYVSFDNAKVGRMQAEALLAAAPRGNYVLLGGSPTDNNAKLVREGQLEVLKPAIASGAVKVIAEPFILNWDTALARAGDGRRADEDTQHRSRGREQRCDGHRSGRRAGRGEANRQGRAVGPGCRSRPPASASSQAHRR